LTSTETLEKDIIHDYVCLFKETQRPEQLVNFLIKGCGNVHIRKASIVLEVASAIIESMQTIFPGSKGRGTRKSELGYSGQ
jgi:hypothetical protein